jgi:phosphoenolpyruvate carboxykinase (ATP)
MQHTAMYSHLSPAEKDAQDKLGLSGSTSVSLNLPPAALIEHALHAGEGTLSDSGALMCDTGVFTGRSPKDKFIVYDSVTASTIDWGEVNQPFTSEDFNRLHQKMRSFLEEKHIYVRYAYAGASKPYQIKIALVTTQAWQSLFCHHLFIRPLQEELSAFNFDWQVLCIPEFEADPITDGTRKGNFTIIDFSRKIILIGGTGYAGEIKKGIFSVLNFTLPLQGVLSMHCSANVGAKGDTALFFGLSGTGKTTLSADPERRLIGDDEHGWAGEEVFNFEGGCYAKVINLSEEGEPQIFGATRFGAILENTRFYPGTRTVNYTDRSVTENTRTAYPLSYIANALEPSVAGCPQNIFFLTADAFGVLPPLSRLSTEQAMYHFISGYTSKLAGTEMGVSSPLATFSACFGAAFLPLHPLQYAHLLGKLIRQYNVKVWLVNTGWVGGGYGTGSRIKLTYTRAMIRAVLDNQLENTYFQKHEIFGLHMPVSCPGVPGELLNPGQTWSDQQAYAQQASKLADGFRKNMARYAAVKGTDLAITEIQPLNPANI